MCIRRFHLFKLTLEEHDTCNVDISILHRSIFTHFADSGCVFISVCFMLILLYTISTTTLFSLVQFILICFSSIVKQAFFAYVNHARIRSWNQPELSNQSNVSCSRKQRGPLVGLELTTDRYPPITDQTCYPLRHAAYIISSSILRCEEFV